MEAENLTDDELNFLTPYVTKMLLRLSDANKQQDSMINQGDAEAWREEAMESEPPQSIGNYFMNSIGYIFFCQAEHFCFF